MTTTHSRHKNKLALYSIVILTIFIGSACQKFLELDPPKTQIIGQIAFSSDENAKAIMTGVYARMSSTGFASGYVNSVTYLAGISSDELKSFSANSQIASFYNNSLLPSNQNVSDLWRDMYQFIYSSNDLLEHLSNASSISVDTKKQLEGEAKFIRAFCYFYLTNLWGDVPLITSTDYRVNAVESRTSKGEVMDKIVSDLIDSQNLLPLTYNTSNNERVRPNKWAATALLARVYLFKDDWQNAEIQSSLLISNSSDYKLTDLDKVFIKNSEEAIWQLMPVYFQNGYNTWEGFLFILNSLPAISLSEQTINAFETGDLRNKSWIGNYQAENQTYFYARKYKIKTSYDQVEYSMVLRLAEQYLIRSEARAHQNNINGAQADLNAIRNRAGLGNTDASTQSQLLLAVENERFVELFSEWGHRWLDLKRTGRLNNIMSAVKENKWQPTSSLYPIPQRDLNNDTNLSQNPGY
jgi:hypothetical protein